MKDFILTSPKPAGAYAVHVNVVLYKPACHFASHIDNPTLRAGIVESVNFYQAVLFTTVGKVIFLYFPRTTLMEFQKAYIDFNITVRWGNPSVYNYLYLKEI